MALAEGMARCDRPLSTTETVRGARKTASRGARELSEVGGTALAPVRSDSVGVWLGGGSGLSSGLQQLRMGLGVGFALHSAGTGPVMSD